jgi:hypothetical protein
LGEFEVILPDKTEFIDNKVLRFVASSPSGETMGENFKNDLNDESVVIKVRPVKAISLLVPEPEDLFHITGRVFDRNGKPLPSNLQVLLFAHKDANSDGKDCPVFAARVTAPTFQLPVM